VSGDDRDRIERIRERAYHLWERGRHVHEVEHWLQAEREIDTETAPAPAAEPKKTPKSKAKAKAARSATPAKPPKPASAVKPAKRKPKTQETHLR